jgi:hypothetical protein
MPTSPPVKVLNLLGFLITGLGLLVAGNLTVVAVGLVTLVGAGVLGVVGRRRS